MTRKEQIPNHAAHRDGDLDNEVLLPTLVLDEGDPTFVFSSHSSSHYP